MEAYTAPKSNTYQLWYPFTAPEGDAGTMAIAISKSQFLIVGPAYAIMVIIIFNFIWSFCNSSFLFLSPPRNKVQKVGAIAVWNSDNPSSAAYAMVKYLGAILIRKNISPPSLRDKVKACAMLMVAVVLASSSLGLGIFYTQIMSLDTIAPVQPNAIFVPYIEDVAASTSPKVDALQGPGVLRALGSAEAFDFHSERSRVSVIQQTLPKSNATHPRSQFDYSYSLSARELGLQTSLSLEIQVTGSCFTEYGWLRDSGDSGQTEAYHLWSSSDGGILAPGPQSGSLSDMGFYAAIDPLIGDHAEYSNKSFALIALTAHVGSYSTSTDPWFLTELANGSTLAAGIGYRIKASRPLLSCWEEDLFCMDGKCSGPLLEDLNIPLGIKLILVTRMASPVISQLGMLAGVSSFKSYIGSQGGRIVDAASATVEAELRRLTLASYLYTRETFRDTTMMARPAGMTNYVEDGKGNLLKGAEKFVLQSNEVQALRLDLVLLAPALVVVLAIIKVGILYLRGRSISPGSRPGRLDRFVREAIELQAPHLYRQHDESEPDMSGRTPKWTGTASSIPLPVE